MASFVLRVLSLTLGIFFIFIGTLKLTPSVNDELYREMRKSFIRGAKVFPFMKMAGLELNPHLYRKIVGGSEVVCGVILVAIPGPLKEASSLLMLFMMLLDVYTHWALNEGLDKMSLSIVFLLLLTCRLIVHLQMRAREIEEKSDTQDKTDSSKTEKKLTEEEKVQEKSAEEKKEQ